MNNAAPAVRPRPEPRSAYVVFREMTTRWRDNDVYGHLNNVVYYEYFDTAVNGWLIDQGLLEIETSPVVGLVVETGCSYFASMGFPDRIAAGIRVARIGGSSVTYEIGLFQNDGAETVAKGRFTHVYVTRADQRPSPLPEPLRAALEPLLRPEREAPDDASHTEVN